MCRKQQSGKKHVAHAQSSLIRPVLRAWNPAQTHIYGDPKRETNKLNLCLCLQQDSLDSPWFHSFLIVLVTCSRKMHFHFPVLFMLMWGVYLWVLYTISCFCCCVQPQLLSVHSCHSFILPLCSGFLTNQLSLLSFHIPVNQKAIMWPSWKGNTFT